MSEPASINPQIVEGLYCEALVLADEVRAAFALSRRTDPAGDDEDLVRIALSCEGLRTTTRISAGARKPASDHDHAHRSRRGRD